MWRNNVPSVCGRGLHRKKTELIVVLNEICDFVAL
jgi:hypothetical protein